jgi:hypothetical protein
LIHCFAGCAPGEILDAVGLEFGHLYPDKLESRKGQRPTWNLRELLVAISQEAIVVACGAEWIGAGKQLDIRDVRRITLAAERIRTALRVGGVHAQ